MKRLHKYLAIAAGVSLLTLPACKKDFLETSSTSSLGDKQAEGTQEGLQGIVNGLHHMMYTYSFGQAFGAGAPSLNLRLDLMSDDVINTQRAYLREYTYLGAHNERGDGVINYLAWDFYYTLIQHTNIAIRGFKNTLSEEERKDKKIRYSVGEAYAFRAYAYHQLVQLFAKRYNASTAASDPGVVMRTDEATNAQLYEKARRGTVAEAYELIESDLKMAMETLKDLDQNNSRNHLRYSTVCGIAARVALSKSDWAAAETYAKEAIANANSKLQVGEELLDGFNDYNANEWMWGYRYAETQNQGYGTFLATYSTNFDNGWQDHFRFAVNRNIFDQLGTNDVRRKWWYCYDLDQNIPEDVDAGYLPLISGVPGFEITGQCMKYRVQNHASSKGDVLIMRLGEMYYIQAEAEARQGKTAAAQTTLYTIVKTRDADFVQPTETGDALIEKIFLHKRLDLLFEGVRFFDMKRLGIVPNRLAAKNFQIIKDFTGAGGGETKYQEAIAKNQNASFETMPKTPDDKNWQFKIPYSEIKVNPLCQQNP